ncbi:MAG: hypothetical protein J4452_00330 [Candidatus Aenigmarchaeota archaeon]|nr:hypothetical protein [Candidatus Aenigmarchaeota archaeon]
MQLTQQYVASRHISNSVIRHLDQEILSQCNPELDDYLAFKDYFIGAGHDFDWLITKRYEEPLAETWLIILFGKPLMEKITAPLKDVRRGYVLIPVSKYLNNFYEAAKSKGITYRDSQEAGAEAALKVPVVDGTWDYFVWLYHLRKKPFVVSTSPKEALDASAKLKLGIPTNDVAGSRYFKKINGQYALTCNMDDMCIAEGKTREYTRLRGATTHAYLRYIFTDDLIWDENWIRDAGYGLVGIAEENESRIALAQIGKYECPARFFVVVPEARQNINAFRRPILSCDLGHFKASLKDPSATLRMREASMEVEDAFRNCLTADESDFVFRKQVTIKKFQKFLSEYRVPLGKEEISLFPILRTGILNLVSKFTSSESLSDSKELSKEFLKRFRANNFEISMKEAHRVEIEELAAILEKNPELRWD